MNTLTRSGPLRCWALTDLRNREWPTLRRVRHQVTRYVGALLTCSHIRYPSRALQRSCRLPRLARELPVILHFPFVLGVPVCRVLCSVDYLYVIHAFWRRFRWFVMREARKGVNHNLVADHIQHGEAFDANPANDDEY